MKDLDELMMESFIEVVDELREIKGIKHVDFIAQVWPESPERSAIARWHGMRNTVSRTGKPQGVLVTDAQRMAMALDEDIAYLFFQASMITKKKLAAAAPPSKRGRPPKANKAAPEAEAPRKRWASDGRPVGTKPKAVKNRRTVAIGVKSK